MSVVRLELTVPDGSDACEVANELARDFCGPVQDSLYGWTGATVEVRSDEEALRERAILAAARYFMPGKP